MADIRQYPKTLNLKAKLPTSVLRETMFAVEKELKAQNTRETNTCAQMFMYVPQGGFVHMK